jgi:hypothetical protein
MSKNPYIHQVDHIDLDFKEEVPIEDCVKEAQNLVFGHGVPVHFNHQGTKYVLDAAEAYSLKCAVQAVLPGF